MKNKWLLFLASALFISACKEDDKPTVVPEPEKKVLIGIEGVSPNGVSTLAEYDIPTQTLENNVFQKANINAMGAQLNDIMIDEESGLITLVLPGSDRVSFCDRNTLKLTGSINNLFQIQKVAKVRADKYYLTSWENDGIISFNPLTRRLRREIDTLGEGPTAILVHDTLAFVANNGGFLVDSTISILNPFEDTLVTELLVGYKPNSMVVDKNNRLWVLCSGVRDQGNPSGSSAGSLFRYNLDTLRMALDSNLTIVPDTVMYFVDNQLKPRNLSYDEASDALYYIGDDPTGKIYMTPAFAKTINETPLIDGNFYGLSINSEEGQLYAMQTPNDIDNNGDFQVYDLAGSLVTSIRVGVKPKLVAIK